MYGRGPALSCDGQWPTGSSRSILPAKQSMVPRRPCRRSRLTCGPYPIEKSTMPFRLWIHRKPRYPQRALPSVHGFDSRTKWRVQKCALERNRLGRSLVDGSRRSDERWCPAQGPIVQSGIGYLGGCSRTTGRIGYGFSFPCSSGAGPVRHDFDQGPNITTTVGLIG